MARLNLLIVFYLFMLADCFLGFILEMKNEQRPLRTKNFLSFKAVKQFNSWRKSSLLVGTLQCFSTGGSDFGLGGWRVSSGLGQSFRAKYRSLAWQPLFHSLIEAMSC